MISLSDAVTLARTKLRTKRIRQIVTTVVSGLVFGLAIGGIMIVNGVGTSVGRYAEAQFDGKYFVTTQLYFTGEGESVEFTDPEVIAAVKRDHAVYVQKRTAAAKRHGVPYDASSEISPVTKIPGTQSEEIIDTLSVAGSQYIAKNPPANSEELLKINSKENMESLVAGFGAEQVTKLSTTSARFEYMKNGSEIFEPELEKDAMVNPEIQPFTDAEQPKLNDLPYQRTDSALLKNYIDESVVSDDAIPIVLPISVAVKEFGDELKLEKRPTNSKLLLDWHNDTNKVLAGKLYSVCYRNGPSQALISQAVEQKNQIAADKKKPGYSDPLLRYVLPQESTCGPVKFADARPEREKQAEQKLRQFERETNPLYEEPIQQKITFQIVGVAPDSYDVTSFRGLEGFVSSFVGLNGQHAAQIPEDYYTELPESVRHEDLLFGTTNEELMYQDFSGTGFVIRFGSLGEAKRFIQEKSCPQEQAWNAGCPDEKPFILIAYGANYMLLDEFSNAVRPVAIGGLAVLGIIAGIIIMAMMGRVMADNRRETAVFRAIGATRRDIGSVYSLYALAIALRIAIFALLLGLLISGGLQLIFGARSTDYAQVVFGILDQATYWSFIGMHWSVGAILIGIIVLGVLSVIPPLLRNLRRNPIDDMRDE